MSTQSPTVNPDEFECVKNKFENVKDIHQLKEVAIIMRDILNDFNKYGDAYNTYIIMLLKIFIEKSKKIDSSNFHFDSTEEVQEREIDFRVYLKNLIE